MRQRFAVISDLNRWLKKRNLKLSDLCPARVNAFSNYRKRKVRTLYRSGNHAMLEQFSILRNDGVIPAELCASSLGRSKFNKRYHHFDHLEHEKGFSPSGLTRYEACISQFLQDRFGNGAVLLSAFSAADISHYLMKHAGLWSPKTAQRVAAPFEHCCGSHLQTGIRHEIFQDVFSRPHHGVAGTFQSSSINNRY